MNDAVNEYSGMKREDLLRQIAPCALCCETCPAMKGGVIETCARRLHHYFEGYYEFQKANATAQSQDHAERFRQFDERLARYTARHCNGCRDDTHGGCCIQGCFILDCTRSHGVDFCAECEAFPCNKLTTGVYPPDILSQWHIRNQRIREVGIEQYAREATALSHYVPFSAETGG